MPRRRPRLKARVAVERDGHLLLAWHERIDEAFWCLPGGGVEPGEGATRAAVRELREEAGIDVEVDGVIWVSDGPGEGDADGIVEVVFRGRAVTGEAALATSGDRSLRRIAWHPADALPDDFRPASLAQRIMAAGGLDRLPTIALGPWRSPADYDPTGRSSSA